MKKEKIKDKEVLEICRKIDINFGDITNDVELPDYVKKQLTKEEVEKVEGYLRTQKLMSYLDEQIEKLEKENKWILYKKIL